MSKFVIDQVMAELDRATAKFPTWPSDPLHALAVLGEEYGELTKAMLQMTYEPHKVTHADVIIEAIQTAAMALRLAMSLDRYEYLPGPQHSQPKITTKAMISPEPVLRNALGAWTHSAWPLTGEDDEWPLSWFVENDLEVSIIELGDDAPAEIVKECCEDGQPEAAAKWEPTKPDGEGWFVFSIHDTDDGPVCVWVRNKQQAEVKS